MSDMVERVARAIAHDDDPRVDWNSISEASKAVYLAFARAAIEAMREPSAQMLIDVGTMSGWDAYAQSSADQCHITWWSDMIDAALSEPSP